MPQKKTDSKKPQPIKTLEEENLLRIVSSWLGGSQNKKKKEASDNISDIHSA